MSKSVFLSARMLVALALILQLFACQSTPTSTTMTLPAEGISDPHLHYFDNKFWLFTGHDVGPETKDWIMPEWLVYSSTDLVTWQHETTISPKDNYMPDDSIKCWAPDAATRNGKYYFYFSHFNKTTGVMHSDRPGGPYKDALGKPLLPENLTPSLEFDPSVYIDDDESQTPYIIFGYKKKGGYYIAQLNEDMVSLAESPKKIEILNDTSPHIDKNFLHKHDGTYYLTSGGFYSTSNNIYGPYEFKGLTGEGHGLGIFSHGSFLEYKGQLFHTWTRYLDRSKSMFRESFMTYAHYKQDGSLVSDVAYLDKHKAWGVARYHADWDKIEAEWFFSSKDVTKLDGIGESNFVVRLQSGSAYLHFPKVLEMKKNTALVMHVSAPTDASLQVRSKDPKGPLLATCILPAQQNDSLFVSSTCQLSNAAGQHDIYILADSSTSADIDIDWIRFQ